MPVSLVNLDVSCSCGLCRFLTPVSCPCCDCHGLCCCFDHDLCLVPSVQRRSHCYCLSLNPWHSWHGLKPLNSPQAFDIADLWEVPELDFTLVLELDLPDLHVKELCLEVRRVSARSTSHRLAACPPFRREPTITLRTGQRIGPASLAACLLL